MATEEQKAELVKWRGKQAARMTDPKERRRYIAESAEIDKNYDAMAERTAAMENVLQKREILGNLKKGGKVKKTGLYRLHKGEKVIPSEIVKASAAGLAGSGKKPANPNENGDKPKLRMQIEKTDDGRFLVEHEWFGGPEPSPRRQRFAPSSVEELLEHVRECCAEDGGKPAEEEAANDEE